MLSDGNYNELVKFRSGPIELPYGENKRIQILEDSEFIECINQKTVDRSISSMTYFEVVSKTYKLTSRGEDELLEFENVCRKQADDKAHQSRQEKIAIAQVIVPAFTFVLGLFVEHFSGIVETVLSFFK